MWLINQIRNDSNQTNFEFDLTIKPTDFCSLTCFTNIIDKLFSEVNNIFEK